MVLGNRAELSLDELTNRLNRLSVGLNEKYIKVSDVLTKAFKAIPESCTRGQTVEYVAQTLASLTSTHPDYSVLAARLEIDELHQNMNGITFTQNLNLLRTTSRVNWAEPSNGQNSKRPRPNKLKKGIISEEFYELALRYGERLDNAIVSGRDYHFTYFGWKTLCQSYLLRKNSNDVHETPQFLFMRVALAIHGQFDDVESILETYELMSKRHFIHASPTLFNAGTVNQYLSSCFLLGMMEDSIDGIFKTLHKTALISKASGGIGIHVSDIRSCGALISGSNGISSGLVPMLRVFNNTARYVDQGGNKRPGAYCVYLEPWHADVFEFLQLRKNHGKEELRARDLFFALWIPDLFMRRVESNEMWSLFSPDEAPGLSDVYGEDFDKLYETYEKTVPPMKVVEAQKLWSEILQSQTETGGPFMLYKDSCNRKSNQKNLGTIKSSNLCCEIVEYTSPEEVAVCNLASVGLPAFVQQIEGKGSMFDFKKLHSVVKVVTRNLDRLIDVCDYPVEEARYSNLKNRPQAIGVQGLADVFFILKIPFESEEASTLNKQIFETIYHASIEASIELAEKLGSYKSFAGSPASQGLLQFDFWESDNDDEFLYNDWGQLKEKVVKIGLRNSLLVAPMPTASTSQIMGYTESFEPLTSNVYSRRVLSGEFINVNRYMVEHFCRLGIWDEKLKNRIIMDNGSVQGIDGLPDEIKKLYKTVWEVPQRRLIDMARERSPFIDQSQSLNLYLQTPTMGKLTGMHFYAWRQGLKTGMYYLRTQAASAAIQFTINCDNTLTGAVKLVDKELRAVKEPILGKYPNNTDSRLHIDFFDKSGTSIKELEEELEEELLLRASTDEDVFGIHDTTPVSCNIKNSDLCESCSG